MNFLNEHKLPLDVPPDTLLYAIRNSDNELNAK